MQYQAIDENGQAYIVTKPSGGTLTPPERAAILRYLRSVGDSSGDLTRAQTRQDVPGQVQGGTSITAPPPTQTDPTKPFNNFDPSLDNAFGRTPVGPTGRSTAPGTPDEADVNRLPPGVLKAKVRPGVDPVPGSNAPGEKWWPNPGDPLYDQYVLNQLLRDYGMEGWTGADRAPIAITREVKDEDGNTTFEPSGQYIVSVRDPKTGEVRALKVAKLSNPTDKGLYGWGLLESKITVEAKDAKLLGHSSMMTIGGVIYGTNNTTGAFEPVPGAPKVIQGWGQPYQIDDGKGNKVWYGTDPADGMPKPIPGMPSSPSVPGYDNPQWVERGGKLVYVGWNQKTGKIEDIPGMTAQPLPDKPLTTAPGGNQVYIKGPDGTFSLAPGITQPTVGMTQWVPDPENKGYHKKQRFSQAGVWEDAIGDPDYSVATGNLAKATPAAGTQVWVMVPGTTNRQMKVIADGAGGYKMPDGVPETRTIPGLTDSVASSPGTDEFQQRWNPETQTYESTKNPNWQPKGTGDQVRQLRELAETKRKELHDKVGKNGYTAAQAELDWNTYWDTQILPRQQQIEFDQRKEIEDRDRLQQAQRSQNLTAASGIGQAMAGLANTQNVQATSPTYGNYIKDFISNVGQGKQGTEIRTEDFMKPVYDLNEVAQYYTAQALRGISPTADAMAGGTGMPGALQSAARGVDVGAAIGNRAFTPSLPGGGGGGTTQITINTGQPEQSGAAPAAPTAGGVGGVQPIMGIDPSQIRKMPATLAEQPFNLGNYRIPM